MFKKNKLAQKNFIIGFVWGFFIVAIIFVIIFFSIINGQQTDDYQNIPQNNSESSEKTHYFDISQADHVYGNFRASLDMVIFSDLACSYSASFHQTYMDLLAESFYQDKVRVIWRHFPLDASHPQARPAAVASECAARQSSFWEFIDILFSHQDLLSDKFYLQTANDLGLNQYQFSACLTDSLVNDLVEAHFQEGFAKGVRGTPVSFINGEIYEGSLDLAGLKTIIDIQLDNIEL